jgi:predicted phage terminase large subunit-like protein
MISEATIERYKYLSFLEKIDDSREHFWDFCKLLEPDFYKKDRRHLRILCYTLENFYYNKLIDSHGHIYHKLMIRMPPQHGKSRTLVNFTKWALGKNNRERIITASYGDTQAGDFSRYTRDGISEIKNIKNSVVFSDIFPETRIKQGNASFQKWALEGQHFNYLGVGVGGGVTGKGATIRIIDDVVKDAEAALSDNALSRIWVWLSGTFSSRNAAIGGDVKEIFCATIWGENDPQMILEKTEPDEWYILSMPVYDQETDTMLCDDMLSKQQYLKLKRRMSIDNRTKMIFQANYHCVALSDDETKVFPISSLKRYKDLPEDEVDPQDPTKTIQNYFTLGFADTADEGTDSFSMPIARVYGNNIYIIDAIFDQENLTIQEGQVVSKIQQHNIQQLVVESNSFGAYFSRRIRELQPKIEVFGQYAKGNKMGRILANAGIVKLFFYFPEEPNPTLTKFINQVCKLMKTSTKEDDAPDSLTGMAAYLEKYHGLFKNDEV